MTSTSRGKFSQPPPSRYHTYVNEWVDFYYHPTESKTTLTPLGVCISSSSICLGIRWTAWDAFSAPTIDPSGGGAPSTPGMDVLNSTFTGIDSSLHYWKTPEVIPSDTTAMARSTKTTGGFNDGILSPTLKSWPLLPEATPKTESAHLAGVIFPSSTADKNLSRYPFHFNDMRSGNVSSVASPSSLYKRENSSGSVTSSSVISPSPTSTAAPLNPSEGGHTFSVFGHNSLAPVPRLPTPPRHEILKNPKHSSSDEMKADNLYVISTEAVRLSKV